jgi:hypothetical protein
LAAQERWQVVDLVWRVQLVLGFNCSWKLGRGLIAAAAVVAA